MVNLNNFLCCGIRHFKDPLNTNNLIQTLFNLPADEALAILKKRGKNIITTDTWNELDDIAHSKAFTVAKVLNADILQDIYNWIEKALEVGMTFKEFQTNLVNSLEKAGWQGQEPSRLDTVFQTNISLSYAAGEYKQLQTITKIYPYWKYHQIDRTHKRPAHALLNNKIFRADDPIWNTIYPPSGFGCGCWVEPVKSGDLSIGDKFLNEFNTNPDYKDNFQLSPLKQFKPDLEKYWEPLKNELQKTLRRA